MAESMRVPRDYICLLCTMARALSNLKEGRGIPATCMIMEEQSAKLGPGCV